MNGAGAGQAVVGRGNLESALRRGRPAHRVGGARGGGQGEGAERPQDQEEVTMCHGVGFLGGSGCQMRVRAINRKSRHRLAPRLAALSVARLVEKLDGGSRAEIPRGLPGAKRPDDLLVRGDLEHLYGAWPVFHVLVAGAPVGHERVAVRQPVGRLQVEDPDVRDVGLGEFPDRFSGGVHFAHVPAPISSDQRVAVVEADGRPRGSRLDRPEHLPAEVVFNDLPLPQVRHEERAGAGHADVAELPVRARDGRRDRNHPLRRPRRRVDDHRLGRIPVSHDQDAAVSERLDRVNLRPGRGRVIPDEPFVGADLARPRHSREDDVSVGQQRRVVELLIGARRRMKRDRRGPHDPALADEEHRLLGLARVPFARVEEGMLREAVAGQDRGGER